RGAVGDSLKSTIVADRSADRSANPPLQNRNDRGAVGDSLKSTIVADRSADRSANPPLQNRNDRGAVGNSLIRAPSTWTSH
ncbi:MAG: hypothetical protein AAGG48_25335, partial [Planctomycetota bacterium]